MNLHTFLVHNRQCDWNRTKVIMQKNKMGMCLSKHIPVLFNRVLFPY